MVRLSWERIDGEWRQWHDSGDGYGPQLKGPNEYEWGTEKSDPCPPEPDEPEEPSWTALTPELQAWVLQKEATRRAEQAAAREAERARLASLGLARLRKRSRDLRRLSGEQIPVFASGMATNAPAEPVDRCITEAEAAALLGVSETSISRARGDGRLQTVYIGRSARVRMSDVQKAIRDGKL